MNLQLLKKLARSSEAQILYSRAKELRLRLFDNESDFSKLQIWYLYFLELYHMLYQELQAKEDFLTEEVLEDDIRTEAYLMLRKEKNDKKSSSTKTKNIVNSTIGKGSVIFKRR
jgi:hypothetical protein